MLSFSENSKPIAQSKLQTKIARSTTDLSGSLKQYAQHGFV
jgi:hypothetical protein